MAQALFSFYFFDKKDYEIPASNGNIRKNTCPRGDWDLEKKKIQISSWPMENEITEAEPIRLLPAVTRNDRWQVAYMNELLELLQEFSQEKFCWRTSQDNCLITSVFNCKPCKEAKKYLLATRCGHCGREAGCITKPRSSMLTKLQFKLTSKTDSQRKLLHDTYTWGLFQICCVSCCLCRLLNYGELKQIIVGCLNRC